MNLYDIKTEEEWQRVLDELRESLSMPTALVDPHSFILQDSGERHELCKAIRSNKQSLIEICAKTQSMMSRQAKETYGVVIVSCAAKMAKCLIPVFLKGKFMGSIVVCGTAVPEEEMSAAMIAKSINRSEEEVNCLIRQVPVVERAKVAKIANRIFDKVNADS